MNLVVSFSDQLNALLVYLGLDQQLLGMGVTSLNLAEGIFSLCGGMLCGVLAKRYFRLFFWIVLCSAGLIFFLEHKAILNINWTALNIFLGLSETATFDSLLTMSVEWLKQNVLVSFFSTLGFLIGLKF